MLPSFVEMTAKYPKRLLDLASNLFSQERIAKASTTASLAHEWQHRSAMVNSLGEFFSPELKVKEISKHQQQAKALIENALLKDPSLLVRDTAVETVGRIVRMSPTQSKAWKKSLESAFLDSKNIVQGEGLFIRESILRILRESNLKPSRKVLNAAKSDLNPQVSYMLKAWQTNSFDSL